MARKSSNTTKSSDFVESQVWGNLSLITKHGEVKYFKRGIPLDTNEGTLEQLLSKLPHGTELTIQLRINHVAQKSELTLDDLI